MEERHRKSRRPRDCGRSRARQGRKQCGGIDADHVDATRQRPEAGYAVTKARPFQTCTRPLVTAAVMILLATLSVAQTRPQAPSASEDQATPRWPDGRVNLGSIPGKKGYWEVRPGLGGFPRA